MSTQPMEPQRVFALKRLSADWSPGVQHKIIHNVQKQSEMQYNYLYEKFSNFIILHHKRKRFPKSAILDFFNHLIDKGQSYLSLLRYRSAMQRPIKLYFSKVDLKNWEDLSLLLNYQKTHHKKLPPEFPFWDLDKVLTMLKKPPFSYINTEFMLQRAFFICLLACPKRIAEFKSISISRSYFSEEKIIFKVHQNFIKKTQTSNYCPKEIIIPQFSSNPQLCPVRNLNIYLKMTEDICKTLNRPRPDSLWIDTLGKPLSLLKMRLWFRKIIFIADPNASLQGTKFHSARNQVASALDARGIPIAQILQHMQWKSASTFQTFYNKLNLNSIKSAVLAGFLS